MSREIQRELIHNWMKRTPLAKVLMINQWGLLRPEKHKITMNELFLM